MTRIGWIRHGVTQWNKEGRAQGMSDIPLDAEGLAQAEMLGKRLKGEKWDFVYSSDLIRAKVTAETIANHIGCEEVRLDVRLREMGGGLIEGTTVVERIAQWGASWAQLDLDRESPESVIRRGTEVKQELVQRHPGANILVVSHGALIGRCLEQWVPSAYSGVHLKNTSLTTIYHSTEGRWECELYNCARHLESVPN